MSEWKNMSFLHMPYQVEKRMVNGKEQWRHRVALRLDQINSFGTVNPNPWITGKPEGYD